MTRPRCHCGWLLSTDEAGFACPRCHRVYLDGSTLPACKRVRTEQVGGDAAMARVRCSDCGSASWLEIPIDEAGT